MAEYTPTIGLEIHAELKTETKMFSRGRNNPDEEAPNRNITAIDLAHPGTLPTINKRALEHMIKVGLALGGTIANFTEFDRKNYFYPDIPKGYQISQYEHPIVSGGELNGIAITRVHLEEDTGNSKHIEGDDAHALIDYNRAGIPLMELVTEPVIHSAEEAGNFARELQLLLRYLGVAETNMEKGEMRVEANISVSDSDKLGTKVEVKNLNSFKSVERAITYEVERMTALLEAGKGDEIAQETRGWDEVKMETFTQRKKEDAHDYRYFPDPDLPKLYLHELFDIETIRASLPELPGARRVRYQKQYGIGEDATNLFVENPHLATYFEQVSESVERESVALASNYITSDLIGLLEQEGTALPDPASFATLIAMNAADEINSRATKDILKILATEGGDPREIAKEKNLMQLSDTDSLKPIVTSVIEGNEEAVAEYKKGKEASLQFLVGQVMKETKGSANPQVTMSLLKELLGK